MIQNAEGVEPACSRDLGAGAQAADVNILMMPDYRAGNPYQELLAQALAKAGARVIFAIGYKRVFPIWRCVREQGDQIEVLHLHWLTPYLRGKTHWTAWLYAFKLYLDLLLVRSMGVRLVWTVHNLISHESAYRTVELWAARKVASRAYSLIVHSESARAEVATAYSVNPAKIRHIAHGHYRGVYGAPIDAEEARRRLALPSVAFVFLFFGYVRPYKGVEELLDAWKQRPHARPTDVLMIVGSPVDPTYGEQLRELAEGRAEIRLDLRRVPDNEVHLYFSAADMVVLPSRRSLTSGSAILALTFGKPVLAPRLGVFEEVLRGKGHFLYEPQSPAALAHGLASCARDQTARLAGKVRGTLDGRDWEPIGNQTLQAYGVRLS